MNGPRRLAKAGGGSLAPFAAGAALLLAAGAREWAPWTMIGAVSALSGTLAWRRARPVPGRSKPGADSGLTYAMQRPIRNVPGRGLSDDAPYTVHVSTHTQIAVLQAPGPGVGPEAIHIPVTGHNLVFTVASTDPENVTVRRIRAEVTDHAALVANGTSMAHSRMPDLVFSPDLLESIQRSVEAYRPLKVPDFAIHLDDPSAPIRAVRDDEPLSLPLTVSGGQSAELVFAPVTDAAHLVRWRLVADLECGGRTTTASWDLMVTASTGMAGYSPDAEPRNARVHELFPDHWDPQEQGEERREPFMVAAHVSADGTGVLATPVRSGPDPESRRATAHRERGDRHAERGEVEAAAEAYRKAIDAGSARAAYSLGVLLHSQDDLAGARRWYEHAAERRVGPAYNNLGTLALVRADLDEADRWFRKAMDHGDWTAAANLGVIARQRGDDALAETLWRLASDNGERGASQNLAVLLNRQGRTAEAEELWRKAADAGDAESAVHIGYLKYQEGDPAEAERWYRQAARQGHSNGAFYLGLLLAHSGRTAEAEDCLRQAAERLGDEPETFLGSRTHHREGFTTALSAAAESAEAKSAHLLADLLLQRGDEAGAEHWLMMAARAGHLDSQCRLAELAWNSNRDITGVLRWTRLAMENEAADPSRLEAITAGLANIADYFLHSEEGPQLRCAVDVWTLVVAAHRRLYAHDEATYRQDYDRALEDLISLLLALPDSDAASAVFTELFRLRNAG